MEVKRLGRETDNSPPTSVNSPICLHGVVEQLYILLLTQKEYSKGSCSTVYYCN
jgi:hypothetical protein